MVEFAQRLHDLTILYLEKTELPKNITPAQLVEIYGEVEKQVEKILISKY